MLIKETKSRSNLLSWVAYVFFVMMFLMGLLQVTSALVKGIKSPFDLVLLLVLPIGLGILGIQMLLWFSRGKEKVSIEIDKLLVEKRGTFWLKKKKAFPLSSIAQIHLQKNFFETHSPAQLVGVFSRQMYILRIQNVGRIKLILTNGKSFRFMDNVSFYEAVQVIRQIEASISKSMS